MREVVGTDGEVELGVAGVDMQVVAADVADCGDVADGGEGEDVVGTVEQVLAELTGSAGFLAGVVVSDEEEGCVGVVDGVADDAVELSGDADAAVGHEVVHVVDDDELRIESLDEALDAAGEPPGVVALAAEDVEAEEVEAFLADGVLGEFAEDGCADVGAVDGVDPEDLAAVAGRSGEPL